MTDEQWRDWRRLVKECEFGDHKTINVGGKRMRKMLISVDSEMKKLKLESILKKEIDIKESEAK